MSKVSTDAAILLQLLQKTATPIVWRGSNDSFIVRALPEGWTVERAEQALAELRLAGAVSETTAPGPICFDLHSRRFVESAVHIVAVKNTDQNKGGEYRSAGWLERTHGIKKVRLSQQTGQGKVRSTKAPPGYVDLHECGGCAVRVLYHVGDALKYCAPQRIRGRKT